MNSLTHSAQTWQLEMKCSSRKFCYVPESCHSGSTGSKVLHLWRHSRKTRLPQGKNFFQVQTRRLAASFETFTGSVEHTGPEIFHAKPHAFRQFFSENPRILADAKELMKIFMTTFIFCISTLVFGCFFFPNEIEKFFDFDFHKLHNMTNVFVQNLFLSHKASHPEPFWNNTLPTQVPARKPYRRSSIRQQPRIYRGPAVDVLIIFIKTIDFKGLSESRKIPFMPLCLFTRGI